MYKGKLEQHPANQNDCISVSHYTAANRLERKIDILNGKVQRTTFYEYDDHR